MPINDLTYYSGFNYQKILIIGSQVVSVPATAPFSPVTVLTIPTGLPYIPTARVSLQYAGQRGIFIQALADMDVSISAYFDPSFNLVIIGSNDSGSSVGSVQINYRIYLDQ